jgi:hypothetical protein
MGSSLVGWFSRPKVLGLAKQAKLGWPMRYATCSAYDFAGWLWLSGLVGLAAQQAVPWVSGSLSQADERGPRVIHYLGCGLEARFGVRVASGVCGCVWVLDGCPQGARLNAVEALAGAMP